jgi:hypothetical protein
LNASASFQSGDVILISPNTVQATDIQMNFSIHVDFGLDLGSFLPQVCLPRVCIDVPFIGTVCSPQECIDRPTVTVPVDYKDQIIFTADFSLLTYLNGPNWAVDIEILAVPFLQLSPFASALIIVIGVAIGAAVSTVPFIGPFLGLLVAAVIVVIGVAGALGLLGLIITPFVAGSRFNIMQKPQRVQLIPYASALEPPVAVTVTALAAAVVQADPTDKA